MSVGGFSSRRSCARTTAIGRPTSPATCSLPSAAKLSTVHSVVSIARSSADSADFAVGAARSERTGRRARRVGGHEPAAKSPSARCAGARP